MTGAADPREAQALARFEALHATDPAGRAVDYHAAVSRTVLALDPSASLALRFAAASQHLERWVLPRASFPMDVLGYKRWRSELARHHAARAGGVLRELGYDEALIGRVGELLTKKNLKGDPEVQTLEDAICLVFVETELEAFARKHDDEKVASILRKTLAKMSDEGRRRVTALVPSLSSRLQALIAAL